MASRKSSQHKGSTQAARPKRGSASGLGPAPAAHSGAVTTPDEVPIGATRRAFDREDLGGGPEGSSLTNTPIEDPVTGGLAGSPTGHGDPIVGSEDDMLKKRTTKKKPASERIKEKF